MDKKPEKIVLIINGEPVDVCATSLTISAKKIKNTLKLFKNQSRESVHSFRFFWTDVIMLNIMTNQLLQSIDTASLKRMVKPVSSLEEDLEEYRKEHKRKLERLQDTIIKPNDKNLPLDYSHELEKYFKTDQVDNENEENIENLVSNETDNNTFEDNVEHSQPQSEQIGADNETQNSDQSKAAVKQNDIVEKKPSIFKPPIDDDEIEVNFSIPNDNKEKTSIKTSQDDLQKNIASFTQNGEIDINSLFD